jgi:hypothetical protein
MMFRSFVVLLILITCLQGRTSATSDEAQFKSSYFSARDAFSGGAAYAQNWAGWLKLHRAIRASPQLSRELRRQPARGGENEDAAFARLRRQMPAAILSVQSSHVYVVQVGVFRNKQHGANFVQRQWPPSTRAPRKAVTFGQAARA